MDRDSGVQVDRSGRYAAVLLTLSNLLLCMTWFICMECMYRDDAVRMVLCALVPAVFVLFEEAAVQYAPNLGVFIAAHAAAAALVCALGSLTAGMLSGPDMTAAGATDLIGLLSGGLVSGLTLLALAVITCMGVYARVRRSRFFHPTFWIFVSGFLQYGLACAMSWTVARYTAKVSIAASAALCICWYGLRGVTNALESTHTNATVPYEQIRRNSRLVLLISLGIAALLTLPVGLLTSGEALFRAAGQVLKAVLRVILLLIARLLYDDAGGETAMTGQEAGGTIDTDLLPGAVDNPLLDIFWTVLLVLLAGAAAVLLIRLAVRALRQFRDDFNRPGRLDGDRVEYLRPGERQQEADRTREGRLRFRDRSPRAQIRRLYRRAIAGGTGADGVRQSHTPRELEEISLGGGQTKSAGHAAPAGTRRDGDAPAAAAVSEEKIRRGEAIAQLHLLYEKARYGYDDSTREEAARMKEHLRNL